MKNYLISNPMIASKDNSGLVFEFFIETEEKVPTNKIIKNCVVLTSDSRKIDCELFIRDKGLNKYVFFVRVHDVKATENTNIYLKYLKYVQIC